MDPLPVAPAPSDDALAAGVRLDVDDLETVGATLVAGGSPWRLLRLSRSALETLDRWTAGEPLEARDRRLARNLVNRGLVRPCFAPTVDLDEIDVVVPVRDDVAVLRRLLAATTGFAVTVVDDGSRDRDAVADCAAAFGAELVRLPESRGPGAARNAGVAVTSRPLLWFLDADVAVEDARGLAARLVAPLGDPLVAASAPRIRAGGGPRRRDRFERELGPLDLGPTSGLVVAGAARGYVPSACLVVRRSALGTGFDESLRVGEDVDLVWRLVDAGWLVRYDGALTVAHEARASWAAWCRQRYGYGTSAAALGARHGARVAPVVVEESTLALVVGLASGRPAVAALAALSLARRIRVRLPEDAQRPGRLTRVLLARAVVGTVGPTARAVVRTYGPLVLASALVPRLRRRALALFALGTLWRWRGRAPLRPLDVPLGVADDVAYALGVWRGALSARDATCVTPRVVRRGER